MTKPPELKKITKIYLVERRYFEYLHIFLKDSNRQYIPKELHFLFKRNKSAIVQTIIDLYKKKVVDEPIISKPLSIA